MGEYQRISCTRYLLTLLSAELHEQRLTLNSLCEIRYLDADFRNCESVGCSNLYSCCRPNIHLLTTDTTAFPYLPCQYYWLIYSFSSCVLGLSHFQSVLNSRVALLPWGLHLLERVMSHRHRNITPMNPCRTGTDPNFIFLPCRFQTTSSFHLRLSFIRHTLGSGLSLPSNS